MFSCVLLQLWAMDCGGNCARVAAAAQLEAVDTAGVKLPDISVYSFSLKRGSNRKDDPRCDMFNQDFSSAKTGVKNNKHP